MSSWHCRFLVDPDMDMDVKTGAPKADGTSLYNKRPLRRDDKDGSVTAELIIPRKPPFLFNFRFRAVATMILSGSQLKGWSEAAPDWQKYVRSPSSTTISPASVISSYTLGNVANPSGFINGTAPTVLTRSVSDASGNIPTIVVDWGQNIVGYVSISFGGASSNSSAGLPGIRLAFSETLQYLTNISDFSRSDNGDTITPGSDQIAVLPNPYTWTDTHGCTYGNQVCADGLHGFRYMKVYLDALPADSPHTTSYGSVTITSMSLSFQAYLGTPSTFTGWLQTSDDQLNQLWYDSVYTNDLCIDEFRVNETEPRGAASPSLIGKSVIMDGAKRDRDPYVGDLAVSAKTSYLTHDVSDAARNVLADLADHQRADGWIPPASINNYTLHLLDYPLWWVVCSYDLYMYTGDTAYITDYYQVLLNVLDNYYPSITNPDTNLITKGIDDSGDYGDYAFLPRTGPVTYYNALYVLALNNAATIATSLGGHNSDASRWTARAKTVGQAINNLLYDTSVGAFFDGVCGYSPCATHAQDGNSISIVSSAVNSSIASSVLSYLSKANSRPYGNSFYDNDLLQDGFGDRVYAFISYFEIEARFLSNSADSALEEIRRLYGWMATHDPQITVWEGIGANGSLYEGSYTSQAHGWSTGIVPSLVNNVLGVKPTGPGFSKWAVKPRPGDVLWAKGVVPGPDSGGKGGVSVSWSRDASEGNFWLSASSAQGSSGVISVPVPGSAGGAKASSGSGGTFAETGTETGACGDEVISKRDVATTDVFLDGKLVFSGGSAVDGFAAQSTGDGYVFSHYPIRLPELSHFKMRMSKISPPQKYVYVLKAVGRNINEELHTSAPAKGVKQNQTLLDFAAPYSSIFNSMIFSSSATSHSPQTPQTPIDTNSLRR
ncbi:hypothetical protein G7Y89_g14975 [Cudoniella acicularis]|uniref:Alpha-L-rhamnosidase six-hairpin glycosidase domain-containing protein n=1 Tax=Cudoniella acicularis TaxID=354080 RepID=A0A8H4VS76_9HELO|nr:hypothetical protein G7Y89_g14975 [Cudoniella acicularis]